MCKKFKSETAENLKLLTGRFPIFQISLAGQFCFVAGNIRRPAAISTTVRQQWFLRNGCSTGISGKTRHSRGNPKLHYGNSTGVKLDSPIKINCSKEP